MAKLVSMAAPNSGEPLAAAAPSSTTSAGAQEGQTATENGMPSANAPQPLATRLASEAERFGNGSLTHPVHSRPKNDQPGAEQQPPPAPGQRLHPLAAESCHGTQQGMRGDQAAR
jgi:hypothetical protein